LGQLVQPAIAVQPATRDLQGRKVQLDLKELQGRKVQLDLRELQESLVLPVIKVFEHKKID
jgi:hypothetical protein